MDQVSTHTLRRYEMAIYQACSIANDCRVFKRTHTVRRIGEFAYTHSPIFGRTQFYGSRQLGRECGDCIIRKQIIRCVIQQRM